MFGPSPRCASVSSSFTLRYVAISSLAQSFTTTMTESEIPWPITSASLQRLGKLCRSYMLPVQPTDRPRVRVITFFAHLPSLLERVTQRILGFGGVSHLTLLSCLTKVHFRLGSKFDVGFFQIPHWLLRLVSLLLQQSV
jgi:hypothetical protein